MRRTSSPIRHDYRALELPPGASTRAPSRPFAWFAVGLGAPLALFAIVFSLRPGGDAAVPDTPREMPVAQAPDSRALDAQPGEPTLPAAALPDILEPQPPAYDELTLQIRSGDTLDQLFRRHELSIGDLMTIAGLDEAREPLRMLKPGDALTVQHDGGRIMQLQRDLGIEQRLMVERQPEGGFTAELLDRPVEIRQRIRHGVIESSLFESASAAGLSERVIMNVAGIFAWDIDFVYDIRVGDAYYVIHEELWQDGAKVADGEIVAAEFVNQGRAYQAIRFVAPDGTSDYFDADGRSVRKAFVRAPVDFTRISSQFNPNRRHPILNTIRAHRGVDYSASRGTPIMAAGDGKIIFRGQQNGYGNVVILQHGGNITTLYAHMSNFRRGQRVGTRVQQGQVIGYVGMTGLATAPHLHYEYRLNGVHRNPRTVELPQADPIDAQHRMAFEQVKTPILAELERYKSTVLASGDETVTRL